ncbi:helix-turn-helix domain-containing protein [Kitasatospora sp. NPDC048540]|uniref:helix-turn-helix domain-containing protein n=1 Tax=Kitasatospora sp. NPDC048540 TaxID=3155634 RepID=UPI0033E1C004
MSERFGFELRRLRTQQGVSLKALSEMAHYSKGYLSRVETGARPATPELAGRCDDVLGAGGALRGLVADQDPEGQSAEPLRPAQLPMAVPDFYGREAVLARLDGLLCEQRMVVCAIDGMAGVGKSALAVHWAHRVRDRFPDGCLFAEIDGPGQDGAWVTPGEVLGGFLRALRPGGPLPTAISERAALFRTLLDGRRMLIVLDGVVSAEQVQPLLPAAPGSMVLVTSRVRMAGLRSAQLLSLDPLSPREAVRMVAAIIGDQRVAAEPVAARRLVEACGLLPLAVQLVATRLAARPRWQIASLVERLEDEEEGSSVLDLGGAAVGTAFRLSYERLGWQAAHALRQIAQLDGPDLSLAAAAAALGADRAEAENLLEELVDASLLDTPAPGRYAFHKLVRSFALSLVRRAELATAGPAGVALAGLSDRIGR